MSVFELFFGWPAGQVWPNIVASGVTAGLAVGWSHRTLRRHIDRRHEQLAEHVTNATGGDAPREADQG